MGWRENLRQASFKNAIFYIDSADSDFGRRTVTHEYPLRDKPYTEDMGRKARADRVTGYLVGNDYQTQRDALIRVCEQAGAGVFVHPYQGSKRVVCTGLTVRERRQDGGYCEVSMTFVEDGINSFPAAIVNAIKAATGAADTGIAAAIDEFLQTIEDISQYPQFVRDELSDVVNTVLGPIESVLNATGEFATGLNLLKNKAQQLLLTPDLLAEQLLSTLRGISGSTSSSSASDIYQELSTIGSTVPDVKPTTGTRAAQARNQQAIIDLVERIALSLNVQTSIGLNYDSYQEAQKRRDLLLEEIDTKQESAGDSFFSAMQSLRVQVVKSLPAPGLPELRNYELRNGTPALVLAYRLYSDADKENEIIKRNRIRHPGFLPGGQSIEVLSDA